MTSDTIFLENETAKRLYQTVRDLPIVDYHCHLSPQEIYEDRVFSDISEIWLAHDHYKWRLMRQAGVPEELVTGNGSAYDKFEAYVGALEYAAGNPLYDWSRMELRSVFHVDLDLTRKNAPEIYRRANETIASESLSPRKLIEAFRVETICTTDDPADDLKYHVLLRQEGYGVRVLPSFRVDRVLRLDLPDFSEYIRRLLSAANVAGASFPDLLEALRRRFAFFVQNGCRVADMGIPEFPSACGTMEECRTTFAKALRGEPVSTEEKDRYIGRLIVFFAGLYEKAGVVSQYHIEVTRNANSEIMRTFGPDAGCDTVGDPVPAEQLIRLLDTILKENRALPKTLLYTLNRQDAEKAATIAGAFRNVSLGAAWWFADHYRGIREQFMTISELSCLGEFPGMLTDSRSFLSYPRHDFFRRILCSYLGELTEGGRCPYETAEKLAKKLSYENAERLIESGC